MARAARDRAAGSSWADNARLLGEVYRRAVDEERRLQRSQAPLRMVVRDGNLLSDR
jgi:hypothetical protein